jgi:hypothetical protein
MPIEPLDFTSKFQRLQRFSTVFPSRARTRGLVLAQKLTT